MSFAVGMPLLKAMSFAGKIPQLGYKIDALEKLMEHPPLQQSSRNFEGKDHQIRFEKVRFSYTETEVIHDVDLELPEGKMTALVGESGSGKSTLAKLLVHFYDLDGVRITLKPSNMVVKSPKDALKSMPVTSIKRIEVIIVYFSQNTWQAPVLCFRVVLFVFF